MFALSALRAPQCLLLFCLYLTDFIFLFLFPFSVPEVVAFVTSQGRMKYVRPLYKALLRSKNGKSVALQTVEKFKTMCVSTDIASFEEMC